MSKRDALLTRLIDGLAAAGQTPDDRAYLLESLAYGNLKLEDQRLSRPTVADAVAKSKR